ncbi:DUF2238 domain-containing protein [Aliiroseovarius subalbicans]|uniref:DUF2238 domain-containing protein n=1 Tax=Aliiroseovarius subalbicans TaxID=2925840 RepID=UPI001F56E1B4|nr:DUF2238 domain-containing protein [Aliiroseovarius subalbicans]MCI2398772.1 DUF2238 domain-containing protein [Aliiroseovarius subalbicans]
MTPSQTPRITRGERRVALFVIAYVLGFTIWFFSIGNTEFIVYIVTMLVLITLVGLSLRAAEYPLRMLWALAIWGLLHCAGGGVPVGDGVLYGAQLIPITSNGEMTLLKYDQLVHGLGFAVTAWVLWHLMTHHYPQTRHSWTAYLFPALASMGLGATNEIIEFSAVVMVQDTGVGGYTNTLLDLCFNATGAILAVVWIAWRERRTRA